MNYMPKRIITRSIMYLALFCVGFVVIFPLYFVLVSSFKNMADVYKMPPKLIGFKPILDHYVYIFTTQKYGQYMWNSTLVAVLSTALSLLIGIPASYAIARNKMQKTSLAILVARLLPIMIFLLPYYFIFSRVKLIDTYTVLILSHMVLSLPLIVWLMTGFMNGIPVELDEAATVDGATKQKCFGSVILPLCSSGVATCTTLSFLGSWNNFQFALILSGTKTRTLPVSLQYFVSGADIRWGRMLAATIVVIIPAILLTLFLQKYIVEGITAGAVKG